MTRSLAEKIDRTCTNKRSFMTRKVARQNGRKLGLREYKCPICGRFHLTSRKGERFVDPDYFTEKP